MRSEGRYTIIILLMLLAFALSGCGPGRSVHIDWVDFLQWEGRQYLRSRQPAEALATLQPGQMLGQVRFTASGNVSNLRYRPRDGHAAFLPQGTPIFTADGYGPHFRLLTRVGDEYRLYQVDNAPAAKVAAEVLDVRGKVRAVHLNETERGEDHLVTLTDPEAVARLVDDLLARSFQPPDRGDGGTADFFLELKLEDGTSSRHPLRTDRMLLTVAHRSVAMDDLIDLQVLVEKACQGG